MVYEVGKIMSMDVFTSLNGVHISEIQISLSMVQAALNSTKLTIPKI